MIQTLIEKIQTGEELFVFGIFCLIALSIVTGGIVKIVQAFTGLFEKRYTYIIKKKNLQK